VIKISRLLRKTQWLAFKGYPNPTTECYFCGEPNLDVLEIHHIIPKHGLFVDSEKTGLENVTVRVCRNCHKKLHRILTVVADYLKLIDLSTKTERAKGIIRSAFWILSLIKKGFTLEKIEKEINFPADIAKSIIKFLLDLELIREVAEGEYECNL